MNLKCFAYERQREERLAKITAEQIFDSELVLKIQNIITLIPEEIAKPIFGDHVKVTIDKEGNITTNDYEHD